MSKLNNQYKDYKRRQYFCKFFLKRQVCKSLLRDPRISIEERQIIYYKRNRFNPNYSITKIKNFCYITGHSRAVYRYVKLSRHHFKNMVLNGDIPGWIVSSW